MNVRRVFFVLFRAGLILTGIIFYETLYNYLWGMSWNTFLSISVFIAGSVYAIVERNFIVGLISVAAALLLPWIQEWLSFYWPWVKANYDFLKFH
ncbi:MAG: hypothetical protein R2860_00045 [Desulfobacterales bacterium]